MAISSNVQDMVSTASVVNAHSANVKQILKERHYIPIYQRDYTWSESNVKQLWEDLFDHIKLDQYGRLINPVGYFLGAMVFIDHDKNNQLYEVVDGQQRLVTLTTMLSVVSAEIKTMEKADIISADEGPWDAYLHTISDCLVHNEGGSLVSNINFEANPAISAFFSEMCRPKKTMFQKRAYWDEHCAELFRNKRGAFYRVRAALEQGSECLLHYLEHREQSQREQVLFSLLRFLLEGVVILKIVSHSHSEAYAIFDSINNRGVKLSQTDLIKNELIRREPNDDLKEQIVELWNSSKDLVETDGFITFPEFLHISYLSRYTRVKANRLQEEVKNKLAAQQHHGLVEASLNFAREIKDDAEAFAGLTGAYKVCWTGKTKDLLSDIQKVLGTKMIYPLLIAAYRRHSTDPMAMESYVYLANSFAFRFLKVMQGSLESFMNVSSDAALLISRPSATIREVSNFLGQHSPDSDFKNSFKDFAVSSSKLGYYTVYWIERYLNDIAKTGLLPVQHGYSQHLEHIMPQTPRIQECPLAYNLKKTPEGGFRELLWRIGNLVPLPASDNTSIKNKHFEQKWSEAYIKSGLKSVSHLKDFHCTDDGDEWGRLSIESRQNYLADELCCKVWSLQLDG
jgi:hypothetical protein